MLITNSKVLAFSLVWFSFFQATDINGHKLKLKKKSANKNKNEMKKIKYFISLFSKQKSLDFNIPWHLFVFILTQD